MRVKRICSRCGTAVYRKSGDVYGFLYWEIEAEELHDPIRCLEAQLAAMTVENARLREALEWLLIGLDEYWVTTDDGQEGVAFAQATLAAKETK